jgi:hypothetical protein
MDLSFTIAAGLCHHSHYTVQVPWNSWPYFTVSGSRPPNLEGQVPVFISPRNRVAQLYHQALGSLFVASFDSKGYGGGIWPSLHKGSSVVLDQSQSYVRTDGQSASLSWCQAPIWGLRPDLYYCQTVACLLMRGAFFDERTGLPFTIAAGHCQCSHSWVRVPRDLWSYIPVSDLRLPQPGGPGSHIYILQEQGGLVIPPGTGFPFRRLLRLEGLWWRYSNLLPRGVPLAVVSSYNPQAMTTRKTCVTRHKYVFIGLLPSNGCHIVERIISEMCLPSCCLAMAIHATILNSSFNLYIMLSYKMSGYRHLITSHALLVIFQPFNRKWIHNIKHCMRVVQGWPRKPWTNVTFIKFSVCEQALSCRNTDLH